MDHSHWIGTTWRACCNMRLPKGPVGPGDTFTYDAACAALRLDPASWLAVGNAEQLDAAPALSETVERRAGKGKRAAVDAGGWVFDANPLEAAADPAPAPETEGAA